MPVLCQKDLSIEVCQVPAFGSADPLGVCRPAIKNYNDMLIGGGCGLDAGIGVPWDGLFTENLIPGSYGVWMIPWPISGKTIQGGKGLTEGAVYEAGTNQWVLTLFGKVLGVDYIVWWGYSPVGTGGVGSSPVGLTFSAYSGPPPPYGARCPFSPLTLQITSAHI